MAGDEDITLGELSRLITGLRSDIVRMQETYVTARVWEVEKRAFEERHASMGREISQLRSRADAVEAAKDAEHKAFDRDLQAVKQAFAEKLAELQLADNAKAEQSRKGRAQTWLAIGLAAFAAILAVGGNLLTSALNGGGA